jgi:ATP-dependent DNA helicase RecG
MKIIDEFLQKLEAIIQSGNYAHVENDKIELKDNSHEASDWTEVYKTTNAFLNTEGGIIIIGVKEDTKAGKYLVTGFNYTNEERTKAIRDIFTDENNLPKPVGELIHFETRSFLGKQLLAIYVDSLADDTKYAFYKGTAYERIITGDHKIAPQKLDSQKEYKNEMIDARELQIVKDATIDDLNVDKLNDYIQLLNSETKVESIKASIDDAASFLKRQSMIRDSKPTFLGMLVCGNAPGDKLHFRCQVDAFVEAIGQNIAQDKKIINDSVLHLMEQSVAFVTRNIQTGISIEQGGTRTYEYPERLIRECVNNSLAHRDYSINEFVSISIVPGAHIQIRNPGKFKQQLIIQHLQHEMPVRRIIAGSSKANNPKLAKVLSVYNKWEGKGYGMATLTNACLDDKIDVPYFLFGVDDITLTIPKGKVLDENMEALFESYSGYIRHKLDGDEISVEQKRILSFLYKSELRNKEDRYTILLTKANNHLKALQTLEEVGLIFRHEKSDELYPIFILDRQLFQKDFKSELKKIFGERYNELPGEHKSVLRFIYERNTFAEEKYPSANEVGGKLWIMRGNADKLEGYEAYKRKIRKIINSLEAANMLRRDNGKAKYLINQLFGENPDIFS